MYPGYTLLLKNKQFVPPLYFCSLNCYIQETIENYRELGHFVKEDVFALATHQGQSHSSVSPDIVFAREGVTDNVFLPNLHLF